MKKIIKGISIGLACLAGMALLTYGGMAMDSLQDKIEIQGRSITELNSQIELKDKEIEENGVAIASLTEENSSLKIENENLRQRTLEIDREIIDIEREIEEAEKIKASSKTIKVEVSGYCSCYLCSEGWGQKTADGTGVHWGVIAAPKEIPFGTKMKIDGFGDMVFTVNDRGGYIKKVGDTYRIDVWFPKHGDAEKYGRRWTTATIIQ